MIRQARLEDVPALIMLGGMMHAESPRYRRYSYRPDKLEALAVPLLDTGIVLLAEDGKEPVGMAIGFVLEQFCTGARQASDLAIYVVPEYRGGRYFLMLMRAFETIARGMRADEICLGVSAGINVDKTVALYERLGYEQDSTGLIKYVRHNETGAAATG